ncbi:MAG TPA: substrate-binding domain-containing protein [Anaerolineaceae bacterium]|nr:substrate-binding domain-containing protein [Anaerolineaceae bacterium]HPN50381.1 substrate-binding domain-containing protein [Anaerolineaceae bacterium]
MDETFLYKQIAETIRQEILKGRLQPGDRLPSIRTLMQEWHCTPGTVQRAYQELAGKGLVISRAGRGTHVASELDLCTPQVRLPLRRAGIVHRAEAFLLEALTAGYELPEIQQAFDLSLDRWRALQEPEALPIESHNLRFAGSHDMAVIWLSSHMPQILPDASLHLSFNGSLGGLMALADGRADLAGCHLWDSETGQYNVPFLRRIFPGQTLLQVHLARRNIGLITLPGNPLKAQGLPDLLRPGMIFANRQTGSGTRVWLDATLQNLNLPTEQIKGYEIEKNTHSEVARAVAEGEANVGLGLESAAAAYELAFIPLVQEQYDLVALAAAASETPLSSLFAWLAKEGAAAMAGLSGYDLTCTGQQNLLHL